MRTNPVFFSLTLIKILHTGRCHCELGTIVLISVCDLPRTLITFNVFDNILSTYVKLISQFFYVIRENLRVFKNLRHSYFSLSIILRTLLYSRMVLDEGVLEARYTYAYVFLLCGVGVNSRPFDMGHLQWILVGRLMRSLVGIVGRRRRLRCHELGQR